MKNKFTVIFGIFIIFMSGCSESNDSGRSEEVSTGPHIVFVIGDEEYRSEESMPMLASILKRELNAEITLCFSVDSAGYIDPNRLNHIEGLDALEDADLMVMFTRFRELPISEVQHILDYAESGKPMAGFRTATHSFLYKTDTTMQYLNAEWPRQVFGQQWITHHGHFDDGDKPLTEVDYIADVRSPVLNGVTPFMAYSWLYHVDGGDWKLYGNSRPLLRGTALRSNHADNGDLDKFPISNPVAWTKTYTGHEGNKSRVFFTTLGHPYDFREESMRKLALNGIYWALGLEDQIPEEGVNAELVSPYEPNNSGFGEKYKKNMRPEMFVFSE